MDASTTRRAPNALSGAHSFARPSDRSVLLHQEPTLMPGRWEPVQYAGDEGSSSAETDLLMPVTRYFQPDGSIIERIDYSVQKRHYCVKNLQDPRVAGKRLIMVLESTTPQYLYEDI